MSHNADKRPSAAGRRVAESKEAYAGSSKQVSSSEPPVSVGARATEVPAAGASAAVATSGEAVSSVSDGASSGMAEFSDSRLKQLGVSEKTGTPRLKRTADPATSSNAPAEKSAEKSAEKPSARPSASRPPARPSARPSAHRPSAVRPSGSSTFDGRRVLTAIGVVAVVLALVAAALAWNQWLRYDDAADIQGAWTQEGSATVITITDSQIVMTEEVSYDYTLDTFAKTITFTFEGYSGTGSYTFSSERNTLVITEETDGETVSTTLVRQ